VTASTSTVRPVKILKYSRLKKGSNLKSQNPF
jgi:hypothetical protein